MHVCCIATDNDVYGLASDDVGKADHVAGARSGRLCPSRVVTCTALNHATIAKQPETHHTPSTPIHTRLQCEDTSDLDVKRFGRILWNRPKHQI